MLIGQRHPAEFARPFQWCLQQRQPFSGDDCPCSGTRDCSLSLQRLSRLATKLRQSWGSIGWISRRQWLHIFWSGLAKQYTDCASYTASAHCSESPERRGKACRARAAGNCTQCRVILYPYSFDRVEHHSRDCGGRCRVTVPSFPSWAMFGRCSYVIRKVVGQDRWTTARRQADGQYKMLGPVSRASRRLRPCFSAHSTVDRQERWREPLPKRPLPGYNVSKSDRYRIGRGIGHSPC